MAEKVELSCAKLMLSSANGIVEKFALDLLFNFMHLLMLQALILKQSENKFCLSLAIYKVVMAGTCIGEDVENRSE